MGTRKCDSGWTEALTSQGVCQILNVTNNQAERNLNINLLFALNYTGRSFEVNSRSTMTRSGHAEKMTWAFPTLTMTNFCISDRTFGWHGRRTGLTLYYIDEQHFQDENRELSLTSNMRSFFQIMATHTMLLGRHVSHG